MSKPSLKPILHGNPVQRPERFPVINRTNVDVIDPDFNLIYVDPDWRKTHGDPAGRKCYEYFKGREEPCSGCGIPKALETKQVQVTEETLDKENNRTVEVHIIPFQDRAGRWLVTEFNIDVTERKRTEAALRESEEMHRNLIDRAFDGIYLIRDKRFVYVNPKFMEITGYGFDEATSEEFEIGVLLTKKSRKLFEDRYRARLRGETIPDQYQFQIRTKDGKIKELELSTASLGHEGDVFVLGIMRDITKRKRDEKRLRDMLREKDVMLREIHHRVKNNMQVISSLLQLQAQQLSSSVLRDAMKASQDRIRSMALIHEKLYRSKTLSRIFFGEYLQDLAGRLMSISNVSASSVTLEIEAENVELDINRAIPCGLIVNELVSNTLKHAFPPGKTGHIRLTMEPESKTRFRLVVSDNGIGLPENVDIQNPATLGLQIVSDLVNQLEGTIEVERNAGTTITIRF